MSFGPRRAHGVAERRVGLHADRLGVAALDRRRRSRPCPGPRRFPWRSARPASRGGPPGRGCARRSRAPRARPPAGPRPACGHPARRASSVALTPSSSRKATTGAWRGRRSRCPRSRSSLEELLLGGRGEPRGEHRRGRGSTAAARPRPFAVVTIIDSNEKRRGLDRDRPSEPVEVAPPILLLISLPPKGDTEMTTTRKVQLRRGRPHRRPDGDARGRAGRRSATRSAAFRRRPLFLAFALLFNVIPVLLQRQDRAEGERREARDRRRDASPLRDGPRADDARRAADADPAHHPAGPAERLCDRTQSQEVRRRRHAGAPLEL